MWWNLLVLSSHKWVNQSSTIYLYREFVLGLGFKMANEKGGIVGSLLSIVAIVLCRGADIAWPWYAPIGTTVFLISGLIASYYWGSNTVEQQTFINKQKNLYQKSSTSQMMLFVFAAVTIGSCFFIPDWLLAVIS